MPSLQLVIPLTNYPHCWELKTQILVRLCLTSGASHRVSEFSLRLESHLAIDSMLLRLL